MTTKVKNNKIEGNVKDFLERIAEERGFRLNPDESKTAMAIRGLEKNFKRYGHYTCPCRVYRESDIADITCPCVYLQDDIKKRGTCKCNLFIV